METLKKLIILIVLAGAGFFIYQNFIATEGEESVEEVNDIPSYGLPPIPGKCQRLATDFENAIYGKATHQTSVSQHNRTYRTFVTCLKKEGFSKAEIRGTVQKINTKVQGYLKMDGS